MGDQVAVLGDGPRMLRGPKVRRRVSFVELFFDLIYLLAVTQLSELLADHHDPLGMLRALLLLLAIWWAWADTTWVTNWFDPDQPSVRLMLLVLALLSLIVSASVPLAYGDRGAWFGGAYAAIQIGRSAFFLVALRGSAVARNRPVGSGRDQSDVRGQPGERQRQSLLRPTFARLLVWKTVSGAFWIAGGLTPGPARLLLWAIAVFVEYAGPPLGFRTPWLGRSKPTDWPVNGWHLAERMQLFILIALGESILIIGKALGSQPDDLVHLVAFLEVALGSVALWWLYFAQAETTRRVIGKSADPGRLARSASYLHLPMVAGIIVSAVGDGAIIANPTGHPDLNSIPYVLGGPAIFLIGHALFTRTVLGVLSAPRLVAVGALAALVPVGLVGSFLVLGGAVTLVLLAAATWETVQSRRTDRPGGWPRWRP